MSLYGVPMGEIRAVDVQAALEAVMSFENWVRFQIEHRILDSLIGMIKTGS